MSPIMPPPVPGIRTVVWKKGACAEPCVLVSKSRLPDDTPSDTCSTVFASSGETSAMTSTTPA
eukprot:CAMPEP_0169463922 /NCGR_PEP_ID=MMETSP1042-20121227/20372_1 /TAXON_ID=464988 /ORGANISM="Hemiselmis andersenii, Strain CCMP1180" /LENGTH=62 /DNA_ID=CAMNT_0009576699 /DNA_START=35 /DNA_END=220 /DNA_ORIENTATION=+